MASDWSAVITTAAVNTSAVNSGVKAMAVITAGSNRELCLRNVDITHSAASTAEIKWRIARLTGTAGSGGTSITVTPRKINPNAPETADFTITAVTGAWGTNPVAADVLIEKQYPTNYPEGQLNLSAGLNEPGIIIAPGASVVLEAVSASTVAVTPSITFQIAQ
jgi:hypothetical protein